MIKVPYSNAFAAGAQLHTVWSLYRSQVHVDSVNVHLDLGLREWNVVPVETPQNTKRFSRTALLRLVPVFGRALMKNNRHYCAIHNPQFDDVNNIEITAFIGFV